MKTIKTQFINELKSQTTVVIDKKRKDLVSNFIGTTCSTFSSFLAKKIKKKFGTEIVFKDNIGSLENLLAKLDPQQFIANSYINDFSDGDNIEERCLKTDVFYIIPSFDTKTIITVDTCTRYTSPIDAIPSLNRPNKAVLGIYGKNYRQVKKSIMNFLHPACDVLEEEDNTERKVDYVDILKYSWDNVEGALTRNNLGTKSTKHIDDILVEEKTKNYIINYISKWKNATSLFSTLGITYKLGILLYGPPGTGKTSMAKAIAAHFDYPLYIVDMSSFCPDMATAISEHSMRSNRIILFEDIDYIFGKREQDRTPEEKANGQAILQLLDGASSASNVIFIATTNAKDSLDPALVRDGRFDLKAYMGDLDKEYAVKMCNSMTITDEDKQNELLSNLEFPVNPAHLQNLIVQYIFNHLDDSAENKKESETSKTSSEKVKNKTGDRRLAPFIL